MFNTYERAIGIDAETKQELFLSANNKVVVKLRRCPCCGGENLMSHGIHKDMCDKCGKLWMSYALAKSRLKKNQTPAGYAYFNQYVTVWLERYLAGLRAPADIVDQAARMDAYYAERSAAEEAVVKVDAGKSSGMRQPGADDLDDLCDLGASDDSNLDKPDGGLYIVKCCFCGEPMLDIRDYGRHTCMECSRDWTNYCRYRRRAAALTEDECKRCMALIRKYVQAANAGHWSPDTMPLAVMVRRRLEYLESLHAK